MADSSAQFPIRMSAISRKQTLLKAIFQMHQQRRLKLVATTCPTTLNPKCSPRSSSSDSLTQQELDDHYTVLKELGSGTYGRSVHAQCHRTKAEIALKILPKSSVKLKDFLREFNYSYYLSPHRGIVNTFDVAFQTDDAFVFAQELAPMGDLFEAITPRIGLTELQAKAVARQIGSALEFMHSKFLVHRDVKPENVLIFDDKITKVKLMDFGMTKKAGTLVRKVSHGIPYTPPEICLATKGEHYSVECNADVWAYAVLLFCMLTGNFPWELAHDSDTYYHEYFGWQKRKSPKPPPQWRRFSARLLRLFRRMLEPRSDRRCSIKEISKYLDDVWMIQGPPSLPLHARLPQPESQSSLTAERKASAPVGHTDETATVEKTTERRVIRSARVDDRSKENRTEASQWISNQR